MLESQLSELMLKKFQQVNMPQNFVIPQLPKDQWDNAAKMVHILIEQGYLQYINEGAFIPIDVARSRRVYREGRTNEPDRDVEAPALYMGEPKSTMQDICDVLDDHFDPNVGAINTQDTLSLNESKRRKLQRCWEKLWCGQ